MTDVPTTIEPATAGEVLEHMLVSQAGRFPTVQRGDGQAPARSNMSTKDMPTNDLFQQEEMRPGDSVGSLLGIGQRGGTGGTDASDAGGVSGETAFSQVFSGSGTNEIAASPSEASFESATFSPTQSFQEAGVNGGSSVSSGSQDFSDGSAGGVEGGGGGAADSPAGRDSFAPAAFGETPTTGSSGFEASQRGQGSGIGTSDNASARPPALTSPDTRSNVPNRPPTQNRSGTPSTPQQPQRAPSTFSPQRTSPSSPQQSAGQPSSRPGQPVQQPRTPGTPSRSSPDATTRPADQRGASPTPVDRTSQIATPPDRVQTPASPRPADATSRPGTSPADQTRTPAAPGPADQVKPPIAQSPVDVKTPIGSNPADLTSPTQTGSPDVQLPNPALDNTTAAQQPGTTPGDATGPTGKNTLGPSDKTPVTGADRQRGTQPSDAVAPTNKPPEALTAPDMLRAIEDAVRSDADGRQRLEWLEQSGLLPEILHELTDKGVNVVPGKEGEGTHFHVEGVGTATGRGTIVLDPLDLRTPELLPWILREEATHLEQWLRGDMPTPLDPSDPTGEKFAHKLIDLEAEANHRVLQVMREHEARGGTLPNTAEFQRYVEARGGRDATLDDVRTRLLDGTLLPAHGFGKTYLEYYQQQCLKLRDAHDTSDASGLDVSRGAGTRQSDHPLLKELPQAVLPELRKLIDSDQITRSEVLRIADTYLALHGALDIARLRELVQTLPYADIFAPDTDDENVKPYISERASQALTDALNKLERLSQSQDPHIQEKLTQMLRGQLTVGECFDLLGLQQRTERFVFPALLVITDIVEANDIRRALRTWDVMRHYGSPLLDVFMRLKPGELHRQLLRPPQNMERLAQSWKWLQDTFKGNTFILNAIQRAEPTLQIKLLSSTSKELEHFAQAHLRVTNLPPELKMLLAQMKPDSFLRLMMDDGQQEGKAKVERVGHFWLALNGQLTTTLPNWLNHILSRFNQGLDNNDRAALRAIGQQIIPAKGVGEKAIATFIEFGLTVQDKPAIKAWTAWNQLPQPLRDALVGNSQQRLTEVLSQGRAMIVRMKDMWAIIERGVNGRTQLQPELVNAIKSLSGKPLETLLAEGDMATIVSRWKDMPTLLERIGQRFSDDTTKLDQLRRIAQDALARRGQPAQLEALCRQVLSILRPLEERYQNNATYNADLKSLDALACRIVYQLHQPNVNRQQIEHACQEMITITARMLQANGNDRTKLAHAQGYLSTMHTGNKEAFSAWLRSTTSSSSPLGGLSIYELARVLRIQDMPSVMYEIQFADLWNEQRPQAEQLWYRMYEMGRDAPLSAATRVKLEGLNPKDLREVFMGTRSVASLAGREITLTDGVTRLTFTTEDVREIRHLLLPVEEQRHLAHMYRRMEQTFADVKIKQVVIEGIGAEGQDTLKTYRRLMSLDPEILDKVLVNPLYMNKMMLHVAGIETMSEQEFKAVFKKMTLNADLPLLFPPDDRSHTYRTGDITGVVSLLRDEAKYLPALKMPTLSEETRQRLFVLGPQHLRAAEIVFRQQMATFTQTSVRREALWRRAFEMTPEKQAILDKMTTGLASNSNQEYLVARHRLEGMDRQLRSFLLVPEHELNSELSSERAVFERIALFQMLVHPEDLRLLLQQLTTQPDLSKIGYAEAGWLSVTEWAWRGDPFNVRLVPRIMTDMRTGLPLYPSPGHIMFLGATRSGKTELLKTLFALVGTNNSIFMVDPKALELVQALGRKIQRTHEVYMYSPTHLEQSVSINPLDFVLPEDVGAASKFAAYWSESFKMQDRGGSLVPGIEGSARTILQAAILHLRATEPDAEFHRLVELFSSPQAFQDALKNTSSSAARGMYNNSIKALFEPSADNSAREAVFRVLRETFSVVEDDRIRQLSAKTTLARSRSQENGGELRTSTPASVFLQQRICFVLDQSIADLPAYEQYNRFLHDLMLSAINDDQLRADEGRGQRPSYGVMAVTDEAGILAKQYGEPFNRASERGAYVGGIGAGKTPDGQRVVGMQLIVASQRMPDDSLADQFAQFLIARAVPGDVEQLSRIIGFVRTKLANTLSVEGKGTKDSTGRVDHNIKVGSEFRSEHEESQSEQTRSGWQEVITSLIDGSFWQKLGRGINLNVQLGKDPALAESAGFDSIRQHAFEEGFPEFIRRDDLPNDIFDGLSETDLRSILQEIRTQQRSLTPQSPYYRAIAADLINTEQQVRTQLAALKKQASPTP